MSNFAPNLSTGPCLYCNGIAKEGPEEMLRCDFCRRTAHITCLNSGTPEGRLLGDNFFTFTCSPCRQNHQDSSVRAKLNTPQLLLLVLYNLHMKDPEGARQGFYHWKIHIYNFINQHWKEIFGPERYKKKKKTLQASLSGQLSHYGQYFVSGYETLQDGGWYKLSMVLPPAQLIQQYTAEKAKCGAPKNVVKEEDMEVSYIKEEVVEAEPFAAGDASFECNSHDESSQGSWFMEKDVLRPRSQPPLSLFDSEEENEDGTAQKKECETDVVKKEVDFEFVDVDEIDEPVDGAKSERQLPATKSSLFTVNTPTVESGDASSTSNWTTGDHVRALSGYEERKLLKELKRLQESGPLLPHLHRLLRKIAVRKSKYENGVPLFDFDTEVCFFKTHGRLQTRAERIKSKVNCEPISCVRVLDRFQRSSKEDYQKVETCSSFLAKLNGESDGPPSYIHSPYTLRNLKPFILRDYESMPLKLCLLQEIIQYPHRSDSDWTSPPRYPIDYCYVMPKHIPAMNQMARHFFWPGIDLSEVLQYPDHTCVVLYRHLVIGFGILVPDTGFNTAYLSFLLVHPEWRRTGIATFILYHLIQTCMGKDITLHVSAANPALILYQKFGFKVEEFLSDFYDKYLPEDSPECKHAMFLRLSR